MKILLTGVNGQVGWELRRTLATLGEVVAPTRAQLDLTDAVALRSFVHEVRPDLIVNPAAYTAVDKAEAEPELAHTINAIAPAVMAEAASQINAAMVHYSTDYVFDGSKPGAYLESDATNPLSVYGRTKLEGEQAIIAAGIPHLILRTSWVYGLRGGNFLLTMQRLFKERDSLNVVNDQFGAPTWSRMIAEASAQIIAQRPFPDNSGIYNLTSAGNISWHDFAQAILARTTLPEGKQVALGAIPAAQYPTAATRPVNSVLSGSKVQKTFGICMPDWEAALDRCIES
ncbi:dTDP-4-dehydrorhamnose reductase [Sulfuriferula thiophila]|uniref:dTDP-4-dehydrorhamnose reductase n=1 Tax=Sulfuriferula thiophila TaxID=1781211 RepID=UPI00278C8F5A|nr:dTDP-4-dehydrorhamnose reductase [Sulfuriferula thiophila]